MASQPISFYALSVELLRSGQTIRFTPTGDSMYPTIKDGEPVIVEPLAPAQVRRGDIVLYQTARGVIAHRVISIERQDGALRFRLRGDASQRCDQPVAASQVLGKVVAVERQGKRRELVSLRAKLFHTLIASLRRSKLRWLRR
jgi:signal peptidase I